MYISFMKYRYFKHKGSDGTDSPWIIRVNKKRKYIDLYYQNNWVEQSMTTKQFYCLGPEYTEITYDDVVLEMI